jgi:uncharacterized membrane protein
LALLSLGSVLITPGLVPASELWGSPITILARAVAVPGATSSVNVLFAPLPWIGVAGLGILFGRFLIHKGERGFFVLLPTGISLLGAFAFFRVVGGRFGNLRIIPIHEWWSFFYIVKYPPSIAYMALTLGIGSLILYGFYCLEKSRFSLWLRPLEILGGSALFFYVVHLFLYSFLGIIMGQEDPSLFIEYLGWFLGLILLVPVCNKYRIFKLSKPSESIWKMF